MGTITRFRENLLLILVAGFVLVACTSAQDSVTLPTSLDRVIVIPISPGQSPTTLSPAITSIPTNIQTPSVSVNPAIRAKLDTQSGQAVVRGSIESIVQELGTKCTQAVAPLRALMAKYESLSFVPPGNTYANAFKIGKECETISPQEWTDFYALELAGWLYR
jgi:hypothetical protein